MKFSVRKSVLLACATIALVAVFLLSGRDNGERTIAEIHDRIRDGKKVEPSHEVPADWFYTQRVWPGKSMPKGQPAKAFAEARKIHDAHISDKSLSQQAVIWSEAGPTNIPGRITDLAVNPNDKNIVYAATAAGGVFKTTDGGGTWAPIFDDQPSLSIGAIAMHPDSPSILLVGSGEANTAGDTYEGDGIYKSTDGGSTWTNVGLPNSYHIGRIVFDPVRPETVYAAVLGRLFGTNSDRGVYRSVDGGDSWVQKKFVNDTTGFVDISVHPSGVILAASWQRYRFPWIRRVGGEGSGVWRSTDAGDSWSLITWGLPPAGQNVGRIGIAMDPESDTCYAIYFDHPGNYLGLYRSNDLGQTWYQADDDNDLASVYLAGGFGWYFGNVRVEPGNASHIWALGGGLFESTDGGSNWTEATETQHVDFHAMYIPPASDPGTFLYTGCDGGVNYSSNMGATWTTFTNMPVTQFYAITVDAQNPNAIYGGTQDNGTLRTITGNTGDWTRIHGGDGFYVLVSPSDSNRVYAEYQWGNLYYSTNRGASFQYGLTGVDYNNERHNWCTPFALDPNSHLRMYYGSNKLYRSTNGAVSWSAISGDLTDGPGTGNLTYGTITTIDVAKTDSQVIYVGTDDGNVWVTQNGGTNWTSVKSGLPVRWVTRVAVDPTSAGTVYVTLSGYKESDHLAHIYRSTNYGAAWSAIDGNLPDWPVNDIIVDPDNISHLIIATDVGVYESFNAGSLWIPLGTGIPIVTVQDLAFHLPTRKLIAGTHGRSMYAVTLPPSLICCVGIRGNVNGDVNQQVNIVDVTYLVAYLFQGGFPPPCVTEADVNASGSTNVVDLTTLANYLFAGGAPPSACP